MKKFLTKLLPTSMFARLMAVFFVGIAIILALSLLLNREERDRLLLQVGGQETAIRIADTVAMLDHLSAAERERIISIINIPPQKVELRAQPITLRATPQQTSIETTEFTQTLQYAIGSDYTIQVELNTPERRQEVYAEFDERDRMGMGRGMGMGRMGHGHMMGRKNQQMQAQQELRNQAYYDRIGATSYFVQVKLQDGQWVTFDTHVFKDSFTSPPRLILTLVLILLALSLLLYWVVHWVTRPLRVLAQAADALGRNINRPPLVEEGPTEIKQAAHAFNTMQKRLQNFLQDRTNIFAAMSHDLKTPITRLRLRAELLSDDVQRKKFEQDLLEMEAMVTESLAFMRGIDTSDQPQPVNITALLESLEADYQDTGHPVTVEGTALAPFMGAAPLLKRCLSNLIDNALFYGEKAHLLLEDSSQLLVIRIQDAGTGIPAEQLEKVFEPFYRLEQSRNRQTGGTGLGLTIARNIVHAHGGEIKLQNLPQGGLEVRLEFPRASVL